MIVSRLWKHQEHRRAVKCAYTPGEGNEIVVIRVDPGLECIVSGPEFLDAVTANLKPVGELTSKLIEFNLFDLLGISHLELAHTRILAFLLDSRASHGFGKEFGSRFLDAVVAGNEPSLVQQHRLTESLDIAFDDIRRERQNIDLLVVDDETRTVVLIENKVHSHEHSNQLKRYVELLRLRFPAGSWRIVPIFLTKKGERPSDPSYLIADYRMVADVVEAMLQEHDFPPESALRITLDHYARMIRRQLVGDLDLAAQAKRLYDLHPHGFEFIVQHRYYPRDQLQELVSKLVTRAANTIKEPEEDTNASGTIAYVRFGHRLFEHLEAQDRAARRMLWTQSRRMLLFQFNVTDKGVILGLFVGPGPDPEREHLFDIARNAGSPFDLSTPPAIAGNRQWQRIYGRALLAADDFEQLDLNRLGRILQDRWDEFVEVEMPRVVAPFAHAQPYRP